MINEIVYWSAWAAFTAACIWAKPRSEMRFWALVFSGLLVQLVGYHRGLTEGRDAAIKAAQTTTILTDRSMPR